MSRPRLRVAVPGDAAPLTVLSRRTFLATYAVHNTAEDMDLYLAQSLTETQWQDILSRTEHRVLLLEDEAGLAGYAEIRQGFTPSSVKTETAVELSRLYVAEDRQGGGLGAVLMKGCIDEAVARGGTGLWLGVWQQNTRAIAFYQRSGFSIVGAQVFPLGRDLQEDWVMLRPIP